MNNKKKQNNKAIVVKETTNSHQLNRIFNIQSIYTDGEKKVKFGEKLKYFEAAASVTPNTSGVVDLLAPAQGVTSTTRDGDSLMIRSMFVHFDFTQLTLVTGTFVRVIVFQWHPSSAGGAPTVTDVLQTAVCNSFHEFNSADQYTVLSDIKFDMSGLIATASTSTTRCSYYGPVPRKSKFIPYVQFTSGQVSGSQKIYMLYIVSVASSVTFDYNTRITFSDV
jgi:hypothetical protein